jgi:hypothetical protein
MDLIATFGPDLPCRYDIRGSFGVLLREALAGNALAVALGPIYTEDPAAELMLPFVRSMRESGWSLTDEEDIAPPDVLQRANVLRSAPVLGHAIDRDMMTEWVRAGLVLEIATRHGIKYVGRWQKMHVPWRLKGTVTGRFGTEPVKGMDWVFNPLSLSETDRKHVVASASERHVAVIDFAAMDVCSMASLVPGLAERYGDAPDMHFRTCELLFPESPAPGGLWEIREAVKKALFTFAYGGHVDRYLQELFDARIPELSAWFRSMEHGVGARLIQERSAVVFRAALSAALPQLIGFNVIPMFTVHDELVLDCSELGLDQLGGLAKAMEDGASLRGGVRYRTKTNTGYTYSEAKGENG